MTPLAICLMISVLGNIILLYAAIAQKIRIVLSEKAINELVGRVTRLEHTLRDMPRKITIVSGDTKEISHEQSITQSQS